MSFWKHVRFVLEFLAVLPGFLIVPWLPRRAVVGLAAWLGAIACHCAPRLRRIALANLELAFGSDMNGAAREAIMRESFRTFTLLTLDMFWFALFNRRRIARWVRFDASFEPYFATTPLIAVTGHLGNWEVMGQAVARRGAPCLSVAAGMVNPWMTRMLDFCRRRGASIVTPQEGAIRALLRAMRQGGRVALLLDQNTVPRDGGVFVPFFGRPVPVSKAAHQLSVRSGAPIFFGYGIPGDDGFYTCVGRGLLSARDGEGEDVVTTRRIAETSERVIREFPGKWLWMYKRWRFRPTDRPASQYPYYAKPIKPRELAPSAATPPAHRHP